MPTGEPSRQEIMDARKAGFKKKRPKKPKNKYRSLAKSEEYLAKLNEWRKDVKDAAKVGKQM